MPFLTYQVSVEQAMRNAARLFQEGGAAAIKVEGGRALADTVERLTAAGLPVMGHIGLTPQHVHRLGGMRQQAREEDAAQELDGRRTRPRRRGSICGRTRGGSRCRRRGCNFPAAYSDDRHRRGSVCDGQVLVSYDATRLFDTFVPPFVKQYAQLGDVVLSAARNMRTSASGVFPHSEGVRSDRIRHLFRKTALVKAAPSGTMLPLGSAEEVVGSFQHGGLHEGHGLIGRSSVAVFRRRSKYLCQSDSVRSEKRLRSLSGYGERYRVLRGAPCRYIFAPSGNEMYPSLSGRSST